MANEQREKERKAEAAVTKMARAGVSRPEIARRIREEFGSDVDPVIVADLALGNVRQEKLKTPVKESVTKKTMEEALKKMKGEDTD